MFDDLGDFLVGSFGVESEDILFELAFDNCVTLLDCIRSTSGRRFVLCFHGFVDLSWTAQAEDFLGLVNHHVERFPCIVGLLAAVLGDEDVAFCDKYVAGRHRGEEAYFWLMGVVFCHD